MAGTDKEEVFDIPFTLEDEEDEEYAGGGFEADGLDIVSDTEEEDEDVETDEEREAREAKEAKEAEDAKAAAQPDIATEVAKAVKGVTDTFGQQLVNMNAQFNEKLEKVTKTLAAANKEPVTIPDKPTNEEWEQDANAAHEKMQAHLAAAKEAENATEDEDVVIDATEGALSPEDLKVKQDASYGQAIKTLPDIDKQGSEAREVFTKIYFNPEYALNKNPNGPVLAMMATNFYFQSKDAAGGEGEEDADLGNIDIDKDPDAAIAAGEKIIADARAKKHGMTKSGKKETAKGKVTLNAEQKKMARQLGVTDESYAEGLAVMGGGN